MPLGTVARHATGRERLRQYLSLELRERPLHGDAWSPEAVQAHPLSVLEFVAIADKREQLRGRTWQPWLRVLIPGV